MTTTTRRRSDYINDIDYQARAINSFCLDNRSLPLVAVCHDWRDQSIIHVWVRTNVSHGVIVDALRATLREMGEQP